MMLATFAAMTWRSYSSLAIVGLLLTIASGDDTVIVFSKAVMTPTISSSTLKWLPIAHYDPTRHEAVIGGIKKTKLADESVEDIPMFVCRASTAGKWLIGTQLKGKKICVIATTSSKVEPHTRYELLQNVDHSARWSWQDWMWSMSTLPEGTVTTGGQELYVARYHERDENRYFIGTLERIDSAFGEITYVKDDGSTDRTKEGEVLVQIEPTSYNLKNVRFETPRAKIKSEPRTLGNVTFSNVGQRREKFAKAFPYTYDYFSDWGHVHATIKNLRTTITLVNGTAMPEISWDMSENMTKDGIYDVEIELEPGTGVSVVVEAEYIEIDVPYAGQLVSCYADAETRLREIVASRKEKTLTNVRARFGPIYFLGNNSLVPTTTPTTIAPTTELQTTFLSSTSTPELRTLVTDDENIIAKDDGPLSLQNTKDSAFGVRASVFFIIFTIACLFSVT